MCSPNISFRKKVTLLCNSSKVLRVFKPGKDYIMKLKFMFYRIRFIFLKKEVVRNLRRTKKYSGKANQGIQMLQKINDEMKREVGME